MVGVAHTASRQQISKGLNWKMASNKHSIRLEPQKSRTAKQHDGGARINVRSLDLHAAYAACRTKRKQPHTSSKQRPINRMIRDRDCRTFLDRFVDFLTTSLSPTLYNCVVVAVVAADAVVLRRLYARAEPFLVAFFRRRNAYLRRQWLERERTFP